MVMRPKLLLEQDSTAFYNLRITFLQPGNCLQDFPSKALLKKNLLHFCACTQSVVLISAWFCKQNYLERLAGALVFLACMCTLGCICVLKAGGKFGQVIPSKK